MYYIPPHPMLVHFPLVMTLLAPILILLAAFGIRKKLVSAKIGLLVIGFQLLNVGLGYLTMELGEKDEKIVRKVVAKVHLLEHEKNAEMLVALNVFALAILIASAFLDTHKRFYFQLASVLILIGACFLVWRTGESGGRLVYKYKAPNAYFIK